MRDTQIVLIERDLLLRMGDEVIHNKYIGEFSSVF